jgi:hypothetical protein
MCFEKILSIKEKKMNYDSSKKKNPVYELHGPPLPLLKKCIHFATTVSESVSS